MFVHTFRFMTICTEVNTAIELTVPVWEGSQIWCKSAQFSAEA